jgi:RNA polymerase-binding transcription factor DksA
MPDLNRVKKSLEERLALLESRVKEVEEDLRHGDVKDFEEYATEAEGDEVLEGLEGSALQEIIQIRGALERIAEGTYGECVNCGEPVGDKRLEAIPHAPQCIKCASGKG